MKRILAFFFSCCLCLVIAMPTAAAEFENTHRNSGNAAVDLVEIALTQVGYSGTKYTDRAARQDIDDSAAFVSWCASEAQIAVDILPQENNTQQLYSFFRNSHQLITDDDYDPNAGDLVFFGENESASQCGIYISSDSVYDEPYITVVLCDSDHTVYKKQYRSNSVKMIAFASPNYSQPRQYETGTYRTTASYLNFRSDPDISAEAICQIPMGTTVTVTEISGEWGKITYNDAIGWINMQYAAVYEDTHTNTSDYAVNWTVIDVSKWQGNINWEKVANGDIKAAILRIGLRGTKTKTILPDERFEEYYNGAKKAGLAVGCYFYSAATTVEEAREEADYVLDRIESLSLQFDMPVYYDVEAGVIEKTGKANIQAITTAFLDRMDEAGIYTGVYASTSWATDYYYADNIIGDHPLWIADWREECGYPGEYGMWQFTEKGSVSGIEERYTDLNICYVDYPSLIADITAGKLPKPDQPYKQGDVNGDGIVTATDARLALRISAKLSTATEKQFLAADVDADSVVTATDARMILRVCAALDVFKADEPESLT